MGEIRIEECGCYDGRWAPDDDSDVSVRCPEHAEDPGYRPGALKMTTREAAIAASVGIRRCLKKGLLTPPVQRTPMPAENGSHV